MPTMMLDAADKDAIISILDSVRQFLLETPPETLTNSDVKDIVSDILSMISLIVTGDQ